MNQFFLLHFKLFNLSLQTQNIARKYLCSKNVNFMTEILRFISYYKLQDQKKIMGLKVALERYSVQAVFVNDKQVTEGFRIKNFVAHLTNFTFNTGFFSFCYIEFIGSTLVNKITYVSIVCFYDT